MIVNPNSMTPIYIQIAEWLETQILNEAIQSDEKIYSQYQLAEMYNINPATAAKGLNLLADQNVLYKKRGLGMFVSNDARHIILNKRKNEKLQSMVMDVTKEAVQLGVGVEELIVMIREMYSDAKGENQ